MEPLKNIGRGAPVEDALVHLKPPVDPSTLAYRQLVEGPFWQAIPAYRNVDEATFLDHMGQAKNTITNPQKLLVSALMGPINGMYGIEDASGNVSIWNSGELFGAIDVALFVLIIGGFLGVTMKTGAISAGIAAIAEPLKRS